MSKQGRLGPRLKEQYRIDQNRWLAEMAFITMQRIMAPHVEAAGYVPSPSFDEIPPVVRDAWIAAAAAIRRRVVKFQLTAEQEAPVKHAAHAGAMLDTEPPLC